MAKSLRDKILQKIEQIRELYYPLILIVGLTGSDKAKLLQELSMLIPVPVVNAHLELSGRMFNLAKDKGHCNYLIFCLGGIIFWELCY